MAREDLGLERPRRGVVGAVDLDLRPRLERADAAAGPCRRRRRGAGGRRRGRPASIGWTRRWTPRPWRSRTMRIVSTRNGMSSVTTSSTECGECQPSRSRSGDSTRTTVSPGARRAAERRGGRRRRRRRRRACGRRRRPRAARSSTAAGSARAAGRRAGAGRRCRRAGRAPRRRLALRADARRGRPPAPPCPRPPSRPRCRALASCAGDRACRAESA